MFPAKKAIIGGLIAAALFMFIYNKSATVRKALGAAA